MSEKRSRLGRTDSGLSDRQRARAQCRQRTHLKRLLEKGGVRTEEVSRKLCEDCETACSHCKHTREHTHTHAISFRSSRKAYGMELTREAVQAA